MKPKLFAERAILTPRNKDVRLLWNEGPFYDSDDGEGVYSDKDILYDIRLRFCQYMHGESLTEILVCRDSHNLKRLYIIAAEFVQSVSGLRRNRLIALLCPS